MHSVVAFCILAAWLSIGGDAQTQGVCVPSLDVTGQQAICGGFVNAQCPNPTDTCTLWPIGSTAGPCCLGCPGGAMPSGDCTMHMPCRRRGEQCIYQTNVPFGTPKRGICCRRSGGGY